VQSDRIGLLVGPNEELFQVPRDLLTLYSPVFDRMCTLPFKESIDQLIKLPEDESSAFEDFLIWIHSYEHRIPAKAEPLIDLAILAHKYQICLLNNQISDTIRTALSEERWKLTPHMIWTAYASTPTNSILRRLLSLGFATSATQQKDCESWKPVFSEFPDFGWDYFYRVHIDRAKFTSITSGGACRFHDHSDVFAWERKDIHKCPYPYGAPLVMPQEKKLSPSSTLKGMQEQLHESIRSEVIRSSPYAGGVTEEEEL
jgi:BTB/POZ domain